MLEGKGFFAKKHGVRAKRFLALSLSLGQNVESNGLFLKWVNLYQYKEKMLARTTINRQNFRVFYSTLNF